MLSFLRADDSFSYGCLKTVKIGRINGKQAQRRATAASALLQHPNATPSIPALSVNCELYVDNRLTGKTVKVYQYRSTSKTHSNPSEHSSVLNRIVWLDNGRTHISPNPNRPHRRIFRCFGICSLRTIRIGKRKTQISTTALKNPNIINCFMGTWQPLGFSQSVWTG